MKAVQEQQQQHEGATQDDLITREDVRQRLGVGMRTLERWMERGIVPYYKIGRLCRFRWSEVSQRLESNGFWTPPTSKGNRGSSPANPNPGGEKL